MSLVLRPSLASLRALRSLSVSGSASSNALIASSGSITFCHCITFLSAFINSSLGASFKIKPLTPVVSARLI